ncbi:MAG TPA: hypothetical protein VGH36_11140 [Acetobacteraceae bacterium]
MAFAAAALDVNWAQKARPYGYQVMWCAIPFWGVVQVMEAAAARTRWIGNSLVAPGGERVLAWQADVGWRACILGGAGAMLTQHTAGFFLLGENLAATAVARGFGTQGRRWFANWIIAQLGDAAVWAFWLPGFIAQMGRVIYSAAHPDASMIPFQIDAAAHFGDVCAVFGGFAIWKGRLLAVTTVLVLVLPGLWELRRDMRWLTQAAMTAFIPLTITTFGFFAVNKLLGYILATFIWIEIPVAILLAVGLNALPGRWLRIGITTMFVLTDGWALHNYYSWSHVPVDQVAAVLAAESRPGDAIVSTKNGATLFALRYFLDQVGGTKLSGFVQTPDRRGPLLPLAAAAPFARVWTVGVLGEMPSVDFAAAPLAWSKGFDRSIGGLQLERYDKRKHE